MQITVCNVFEGAEAKKVFEDAQQMIRMICSDRCIQAHGVIGLFPAFSDGDDIKLLNEEKSDIIATFFGLRQQVNILFSKGSVIIKIFLRKRRRGENNITAFQISFALEIWTLIIMLGYLQCLQDLG